MTMRNSWATSLKTNLRTSRTHVGCRASKVFLNGSSTEYNCQLCDVVYGMMVGEASVLRRKKIDGELLCTVGLKESSKNNGHPENGPSNARRPIIHTMIDLYIASLG